MRSGLSSHAVVVLWIAGCLAGGTCYAAEPAAAGASTPPMLPGTQPLTWTGDIASRMVDGADRFLLAEIEKSIERRAASGTVTNRPAEAYDASIEPNRKRLEHILGVRDARVAFDSPD